MENIETLEHYERTVDLYKQLFRINPTIIAYDMHPDYLPTKYALEQVEKHGWKPVAVQHHHAHIASCLADNSKEGPVIGVAFDGTGYGTDGHIWGGEFLVADYKGFRRAGQLQYLPLPGGALAIKKPYRTALGYMLALLGESALDNRLSFLDRIAAAERELVRRQVESNLNSPLTSSMGRLFDAVSAMAGICPTIDYEAQAAIGMEMAAYSAPGEEGSYPFTLTGDNSYTVVLLHELIAAVLDDLLKGRHFSVVAMRFHNTIAIIAHDVCMKIRRESGLNSVALSGGCFQNRLLLTRVTSLLNKSGFDVLTHKDVPANDGGISLGQAVIAANTT
jgi:hydrogenase maturation protein HypF